MAINWEIKITDVDLTAKRADVTATRTDTESTTEPKVYRLENTPLETAQDRQLVLATIKGWVEQDAIRDSGAKQFIANLEQEAKAHLETWELNRAPAGGE